MAAPLYNRAGRGNAPMGPGQRRVKRMQTQLAQLNQARTSGTKPLTQQDTTKLLALKERLGRPLVPWARAMIPGLPPVVDPETGRRVPGTPGRVPTPNPPYSRGGNRRQGPGGFNATAGYGRQRADLPKPQNRQAPAGVPASGFSETVTPGGGVRAQGGPRQTSPGMARYFRNRSRAFKPRAGRGRFRPPLS